MTTKIQKSFGSLRVQSVMYGNEVARVEKTIRHLNRAADLAIAAGVFSSVELIYGDASPQCIFDEQSLESVQNESYALKSIDVDFFGKNLGSAAGHNRLLEGTNTDFVLIMNPDVMLSPNALIELVRPYTEQSVGMVEARQLPIEHPKDYNTTTGETGWATTACALIPTKLIKSIGGFDSDSFFLYCDDVDLSWRIRLEKYKVIYQPSASVFHDKRLSNNGTWLPSGSEQYYSAEAALMMAHKYSRPALVLELLESFENSQTDNLIRAAEVFTSKRDAGKLPTPIDGAHKVSSFNGDFYTNHRFSL
ncbi:glycosyltransferase family 2 protein [Pseudomonas alliivorans]|nr:glycosyltransferase family 2 protein [Pseudomonas alliivorans]MEE5039623.1 glycosyltransferase family 2 protein [Pseudomonas alliivorans]MEE5066224.1 glycosyltransferase family 2 protein [Pseudomonas alliivorans]